MIETLRRSPEQAPELWGNVTDPLDPDPSGYFRHLLHIDTGLEIGIDGGLDDRPENGTARYLLHELGALKSIDYLSASLVDNNHRVLFQGSESNFGFVLAANAASVVATHSRDMHTWSKPYDEIRSKFPVQDPDELLIATPEHDHNEVLLDTDGIVIQAIFWVKPYNEADEPPIPKAEIKRLAEEAGFSFVELDLIKH